VSLVVAFLAAGFVAVTTFMVVRWSEPLNESQEEVIHQKNEASAQEIARVNESASAANAKAEAFRLQIAEAEVRAAEAKVALERFKAPRTLSPEQQQRIATILRTFQGMRFDTAVQIEPEPQALCKLPRVNFLEFAPTNLKALKVI
jgi:hypothetical protein